MFEILKQVHSVKILNELNYFKFEYFKMLFEDSSLIESGIGQDLCWKTLNRQDRMIETLK